MLWSRRHSDSDSLNLSARAYSVSGKLELLVLLTSPRQSFCRGVSLLLLLPVMLNCSL